MNKFVSRGMWFTLCVGGLWLAGTAAANAAESSGTDGVATGDQAVVGISIPVSLSGTAVSVLGDASSSDSTAAAPAAPAAPSASLSPDSVSGVLSGDQAVVDVSVPVQVAGNAISVLGDSGSSGSEASAPAAGSGAGTSTTSSGADGIASGIQAPVAVDVPVTAGGNAISVLGDASSTGAATSTPSSGSGSSATATGAGADGGILSGIQAPVGAAVPVTAGGNAVSVLGDATSSGSATSAPAAGDGTTAASGSDGGILSGVQAPVDAALPVTVGGNVIAVVGDAGSTGSATAAPATGGATAGGGTTTGTDGGGLLGGIDLPIGIDVPVTVGGNAISVVGDSETTDSATAPTVPTTPTTPTTPAMPATPSAPASLTANDGVGTVSASAGGVMTLAAGTMSGSATLASTGSDELGLGAVGALLALLGVMLAFAASNRQRRHHTR
ncbi:chaplin family protein [Leifsonia sp. RAF41]|uniref:chaplin family protein n=1 Tax=Leifsonia sp. RAF41 TaxID=3233056 RepID=UPI003F9A7D23